jgi:hypothetical protein
MAGIYIKEKEMNIKDTLTPPLLQKIYDNARNLLALPENCIYALIKDGEIVYVGKTTIGLRRVYAHIGQKDFDRYSVLDYTNFCENEQDFIDNLGYYEGLTILLLDPPLNRSLPGETPVMTITQAINNLKATDSEVVKIVSTLEKFVFRGKPYYGVKEVLDLIDENRKEQGEESVRLQNTKTRK